VKPTDITPAKTLRPEDFEEFERRDEEQILAEIQGRVIEEMVYSFRSGGRTVTGLSWVGVKEIARRYGQVDVDLVEIRDTPEAWVAVVKARDRERGTGILGVSTQAKVMDTREGPRPDPFALQKAMSKAQRNAIRALIPETFIKTVVQEWLEMQGRAPRRPQRRAPQAPENPPQQRHPRDAEPTLEERVLAALADQGLTTYELDMIRQDGKLLVIHPGDWTNKRLTEYASALAMAGLTPIYYAAKNAWEVEG